MLRDFFAGVKFLGQGFRRVYRRPRLAILGLLPALLSLILFGFLFVTLFYFLGDLTDKVTWFADDWSAAWRGSVRFAAGVAIVGVSGLLAVLLYTTVTLLIGDPFYESIAGAVEDELGGVPNEVPMPWYRSLARGLVESLRLMLVSVCIAIPLFVLGFIPVVGQTVIPVLGALVGGWFLALEMVGMAFMRRGLKLRDRRQMLRKNRSLALGLGVGVFVCFLIPLGAVIVMPAAVAGGTLLTRHIYGLPTALPPSPTA